MRYRYCILSSFLLMKYPYNQYITCMNFMNVEVCWCMMMFRMVLSLVSSLLELESMAWYMNIKTQPINLLLVFQLSFTYLDSSQSLSKYSTISYIYLIYLTSYLVMQTLMLFMHYVYYYNRLNCYGCCYYWLYLFFIYANTAILVLIFTLVCVPYMFYFYLYFYIYNTISIIKIYRIYAFAYNTFTMLCTYYLNMWYFIIINQQQYPNYSPVCTYLYWYVRISNTRRLT